MHELSPAATVMMEQIQGQPIPAARALVVSWDGTGPETDGTIRGGEFLAIDETSFDRLAHFREFTLPGGDVAIRQPRRCALGLLFEIFGPDVFNHTELIPLREFSRKERRMLERMLAGGINSPITSSAGRLFDGVASIVGLRQRVSFEGQAARELEFAAAAGEDGIYPFEFWKAMPAVFDWQPMIHEILADLRRGQAVGSIAAKVHNTLVEVIVAVVHAIGETNVVLSGGCFQNQYLTERSIRRLRDEGFVPHRHRRVPPNGGGIALEQIMAALRAPVRVPETGPSPDGQRQEAAAEWSEPVLKP